MFFNFDYSSSQISFKHEFNSFDFHFFNVKIKPFVTEVVGLWSVVSFSSLIYLSGLVIYLFWNYFDQTMLVRKKIRRHFFLSKKLSHLNGVDVKLTVISFLLRHLLENNVIHIDVLLIWVLRVLVSIANQIRRKPLREEGWQSVNNRFILLFVFRFNLLNLFSSLEINLIWILYFYLFIFFVIF